jgi:hypothetical protein
MMEISPSSVASAEAAGQLLAPEKRTMLLYEYLVICTD